MAWTAPRDWVTGELVSASLMNTHVRDNLTYIDGLMDVATGHSHDGTTTDAGPKIAAAGLADNIDASAKGFNADKVDGLHAADIISGGLIVGAIVMWSGTMGGTDSHHPVVGGSADTNWHICDGTAGTPNLGDKFIVAKGATYASGTTGGSATVNVSHTHDVGSYESATHRHAISFTSGAADGVGTLEAGFSGAAATTTHTHAVAGNSGYAGGAAITGTSATGGSTTAAIIPPYYCLIYLMKIA